MVVLVLDQIHKSYRQGTLPSFVLKDANFTLFEQEVVALVGASGSGKSTFLMIAGLLDAPDSGEIVIKGVSCGNLSENERTRIRRENIGFIYQFHHLLPEFTALENLVIPQLLIGRDSKMAKEKAKAVLSLLGILNKQTSLPSELSGGEQQRVAIARSLINDPNLILADEPTGNLDPENSAIAIDLIIKQVRELGVSAIIVTHNLELAKKADRIVTLCEGKIIDY